MTTPPAGEDMRARMQRMVSETQDSICAALEALEPQARFVRDRWERPGGGGGETRIISGGEVFEKAGVNTSAVFGKLPLEAARSMGGGERIVASASAASNTTLPFFATGVSVVIHAVNPHVPTAHCNYRYFEVGEDAECWWFGGGSDLTPTYLVEEDVRHFHRTHRELCDRFDSTYYPGFKLWCDEYFYVKHRGEARGVGGIFFDDLHGEDPDALFDFAAAAAAGFTEAYLPIVERRKDEAYGEAERRWQALRRGRYVEFNLVYDRGTTFGLRSGGRTESILMSLPLSARWEYDHQVEPDSPEGRLLAVLRKPRDWA